jgi:hypothetical protein
MRHGTLDKCCRRDTVFVPQSVAERKRGAWDPVDCSWKCSGGFPETPNPELAKNCMECEEYLTIMSIDLKDCDSFCFGRTRVQKPSKCLAAIHAVLILGWTVPIEDLKEVIIGVHQMVSEDFELEDIHIYKVVHSDLDGRREQKIDITKTEIMISLDGLEPLRMPQAFDTLNRLPSIVYALPMRGLSIASAELLNLSATPGATSWTCNDGYTFNNFTNRFATNNVRSSSDFSSETEGCDLLWNSLTSPVCR